MVRQEPWVCGRWAKAGDSAEGVLQPAGGKDEDGLVPDTSEDRCLLGEPLGVLRLIMQDGGPDQEGGRGGSLPRHMGRQLLPLALAAYPGP